MKLNASKKLCTASIHRILFLKLVLKKVFQGRLSGSKKRRGRKRRRGAYIFEFSFN